MPRPWKSIRNCALIPPLRLELETAIIEALFHKLRIRLYLIDTGQPQAWENKGGPTPPACEETGVIPVLRRAANLAEMNRRATKRTNSPTPPLEREEKGIAQSSTT